MSPATAAPPTQQDALALHQRLLRGEDPTAANDLADAYLAPLVAWLGETNPGVEEDLRLEAAEDALLALIRAPGSYAPELQTLEVYLRLSARGDLRNRLRKERRHDRGRTPWSAVEHLPDAGKYLGRDDDPALRLRVREEEARLADTIPDSVRRGLSEVDLRALELILRKERRTRVYAELWGLLHLPEADQRKAVKRNKDRLKNVLKRAGRKP